MDNKKFMELVAQRTGLDPERASDVVEKLAEVISEVIADEDCVVVPSFGSFEPKKKMERIVLHPSTGRKLLVPPKLSLGFKPSAVLKNLIK